ncbi:MAG TPA: hypothetical protein VJM50_11365 [Pyrinomonadaceae bacterium]|nr:hypothetical protein [Pyrinomonadaceae bacterium]
MTIAQSVAEVLDQHVTLELECIDRVYCNLYVPMLQTEGGVAWFFREHRGHDFASSALMAPMTRKFVESVEAFAQREGVELITFKRGERKDEVAQRYLAQFPGQEGVLFIGKAQEKAPVVRTERRRNPITGATYPWLVKTTLFVNYYYFYCVDRDFGPFFIKFCSYFPYNGKLCLNGHEYLKRQLSRRGVAFEALDNGILSCADPEQMQHLADGLDSQKIDALARKWFRRLPHPFPAKDRAAGFRYDISLLQAEFSLTQVFDRPLSGRFFFEQVIRDNLDAGRPDQVQLIFDRRVMRTTPGRFRTRVITEGVIPSLHIDYKHSRIKQYHKEGRALRTETIINDTRDFEIGRRLENLSALRKVGFTANRRLLSVQRISHDCALGEDAFNEIHSPAQHDGQRASALRFGDPRVLALLSALVVFRLLPRGFSNRDLRLHLAPLLGLPLELMTQGRMTYDLRRLRVHGLIARIPKSHRYRVTESGFRAAVFLTRAHSRLFRHGLAVLRPRDPPRPAPLREAISRLEQAVDHLWRDVA